MVKWPLLDIGLQRDSAESLVFSTYPLPGSTPKALFRSTTIPIPSLESWIKAVRVVADSVERLPQDKKASPVPLNVRSSTPFEALSIAYDLREKATNRYFIRLIDKDGVIAWTAYGGKKHLMELFAAMEATIKEPPRSVDSYYQKVECSGLVYPEVVNAQKVSEALLGFPGPGGTSLEFRIDTTGKPVLSSVRVNLTSGTKFTDAARKALHQIRYTPARCSDGPIEMYVAQNFFRGAPQVGTSVFIRRP